MPYITKDQRKDVEETGPYTSGELNYAITILIKKYIGNRVAGQSYAVFNEIIGALECAKLELYRRLVAPYEDEKIQENGDVYSCACPIALSKRRKT